MVTVGNEDYYELLGLSRNASEKEIKSAYKKAARKYHPDNSDTGNEDMFKKVGEAYECLKDPQKKSIYDQYGKEGLKGMGGFGAGGFGGFSGAEGFEDLGDIFSSFFGGGFGGGRAGSRAQRPTQGQDHGVDVVIDFLDPINELSKKIRFNPLSQCEKCDGKGAEKAEDIITCSTCGGAGQVSTVQNTILGQIRQTTTCPSCNGNGKEIKNKCGSCKGQGYKRIDKEVEVKIPAGVYDGATIRLAGMGDSGRNGGPPGDIYLHVHINNDKRFERDVEEVYSNLVIDMAEAALGTKIKIPTIRGEKEIKIDAGTQSGDKKVLRDEGFPKINNPRRNGDHIINIVVKTPTKLSSKEKKLLEELRELRRD